MKRTKASSNFSSLIIGLISIFGVACSNVAVKPRNVASTDQATDVTTESENAWRSWIADPTHLSAIQNTDLNASTDDLEVFKTLIGDAPLVGLGENDHGDHEFPALRNRLFKYLASDAGFRVIVIESGILESRMVERYIQGDSSLKIEDLLMNGITHNMGYWEEMKDLVEMLRSYNAGKTNGAEKVHFVGFDLPAEGDAPVLPLQELSTYLKKVDPDYISKLAPTLQIAEKAYAITKQVRAGWKAQSGPNSEIDADYLDAFSSIGWEQLSQIEQDELLSGVRAVEKHVKQNRKQYIKQSSALEYAWNEHLPVVALQHLRDLNERMPTVQDPDKKIYDYLKAVNLLKQGGIYASLDASKINLKRNVDEDFLGDKSVPASDRAAAYLENSRERGTRERADAENVRWAQKTYGRALAFAHIGHLMHGSPDVDLQIGDLKIQGQGASSEGDYLKQFYGSKYVMFTTSYDKKLDVSGNPITQEFNIPFPTVEQTAGCLEQAFLAEPVSTSAYIADLRKLTSPAKDWLNTMRPSRWQTTFQNLNIIQSAELLIYFPSVHDGKKLTF